MCHTRVATIEMLVDDVLLEIFDFCRDMHYIWRNWPLCSGGFWHILVHVCRRWRKIIFDSPRRLNLRLRCTYGSPARKHLGIWPAFPIDLVFSFPSEMRPDDEDNAIATLEHPDRVHSVSLLVRGAQLEKIAAVMQEPFPVLTRLYLHSWYEDASVFTAGFLGGSAPHLQENHLTSHSLPGIADTPFVHQ
jgi:hypothetical protein